MRDALRQGKLAMAGALATALYAIAAVLTYQLDWALWWAWVLGAGLFVFNTGLSASTAYTRGRRDAYKDVLELIDRYQS